MLVGDAVIALDAVIVDVGFIIVTEVITITGRRVVHPLQVVNAVSDVFCDCIGFR